MNPPGSAKALYARGTHPRVLIGPGELDRIRRRASSRLGRKIADATRTRVRPFVREIMAQSSDDEVLAAIEGGAFAKTVYWNLHDIAMVGGLDEDAEATEAARRVL